MLIQVSCLQCTEWEQLSGEDKCQMLKELLDSSQGKKGANQLSQASECRTDCNKFQLSSSAINKHNNDGGALRA